MADHHSFDWMICMFNVGVGNLYKHCLDGYIVSRKEAMRQKAPRHIWPNIFILMGIHFVLQYESGDCCNDLYIGRRAVLFNRKLGINLSHLGHKATKHGPTFFVWIGILFSIWGWVGDDALLCYFRMTAVSFSRKLWFILPRIWDKRYCNMSDHSRFVQLKYLQMDFSSLWS